MLQNLKDHVPDSVVDDAPEDGVTFKAINGTIKATDRYGESEYWYKGRRIVRNSDERNDHFHSESKVRWQIGLRREYPTLAQAKAFIDSKAEATK